MLEAVKLAVEQGVDVNAANTDGRTALDAARALKYESVVQYLQQKGAKRAGLSAAVGLGTSDYGTTTVGRSPVHVARPLLFLARYLEFIV